MSIRDMNFFRCVYTIQSLYVCSAHKTYIIKIFLQWLVNAAITFFSPVKWKKQQQKMYFSYFHSFCSYFRHISAFLSISLCHTRFVTRATDQQKKSSRKKRFSLTNLFTHFEIHCGSIHILFLPCLSTQEKSIG